MKTDLYSVRLRAAEIIMFHDFTLEGATDQRLFAEKVQNIRRHFKAEFYPQNELNVAYHVLRRAALYISSTKNWSVVIPQPIAKLPFPPSFISKNRFDHIEELEFFDERFKERIPEVRKRYRNDPETLLGLSLYSAATRGGLYSKKWLTSLTSKLLTADKPLNVLDDQLFWIDLYVPITTGRYNFRSEEGEYQYTRFHPDTLTVLLICFYLKARNNRNDLTKEYQVFSYIHKALYDTDKPTQGIKNLSHLVNGASGYHFEPGGVGLSYTLANCALGTSPSFCIDDQSWLNLYKTPILELRSTTTPEFNNKNLETGKKRRKKTSSYYGSSGSIDKFYTGMKQRIFHPKLKSKYGIKQSIETFLNRFPDIPLAHKVIGGWFALKAGEIKPISLQAYWGHIWDEWFDAFAGLPIENYGAGDLMMIYESLVDPINYENIPAKRKSHIFHIHQYGRLKFDLPHIEDLSTFKTGESRSFVRTKILSHTFYRAVLERLETYTDDNYHFCQLRVTTILAYRLGLRIGETLQLKICEIDITGGWWVYVQDSNLGEIKTPAARRKLPLFILTTTEELEFIKNFVLDRSKDHKPENRLFGFAGGDSNLDEIKTSHKIASAIRDVTGDPGFVTHSLRHSHATMMMAVAESDYDLASTLSGLTVEHLKGIRNHALLTKTKRRGVYWAIAKMFGHSSPAETLASYMHLYNLLMHRKLERAYSGSSEPLIHSLLQKNIKLSEVRDKPTTLKKIVKNNLEFISKRIHSSSKELPSSKLEVAQFYSMQRYWQVLDRIDQGYELEQIKDELAISMKRIVEVCENALAFLEISTRRHLPRYYPYKGDINSFIKQMKKLLKGSLELTSEGPNQGGFEFKHALEDKPQLAPSQLKSALARGLVDRIFSIMHSKSVDGGKAHILKVTKSILRGYINSTTPIRYNDPQQLNDLVRLLQKEVPFVRWKVTLDLPKGKLGKSNLAYWRECLPSGVSLKVNRQNKLKNQKQNPHGIANVTFDHRHKSDRDTERLFGATILKYVAMMFMIVKGTPRGIRGIMKGKPTKR